MTLNDILYLWDLLPGDQLYGDVKAKVFDDIEFHLNQTFNDDQIESVQTVDDLTRLIYEPA